MTATGTAFWREFDERILASRADVEDLNIAAFRQQLKDTGCAILNADFDPESAAYARLRVGWNKLCRGDKKMEDKFPKVAALLEMALQPFLDELAMERRRIDAVLERLRTQEA